MKSLSRVVISALLLAALLVGTFSVYAQDEATVEDVEPTFTVVGDAVLRDTAHDVVGEDVDVLWAGRTGTLLAKTRAGRFVYVEMDNGAVGWVLVEALETKYPIDELPVEKSGDVEVVPPTSPVVTVAADTPLRDAAHDIVGETLEVVLAGEEIPVLGTTRAGSFVYVETITGAKGWLSLDNAELNVGKTALVVMQSGKVEIVMPVEPAFTVGADATVGDRPAVRYHPVEDVWAGRAGTLLGRTANTHFVYVEMDSMAAGWLPVEAVVTGFPLVRLPVEREVAINAPAAQDFTVTDDATVGDRPAVRYHPVEDVWAGREGTFVGKTANDHYVYVEMDSGTMGWLSADVVESAYPVSALPTVREVEIVEPMAQDFTVAGDFTLGDRPAERYHPVETLWAGRAGTLLGKTANAHYVYVEMDSGAMGWLLADLVESDYPISALPTVREVEIVEPVAFTATVTADTPLRTEAHEALGEDLETLLEGEEAVVLGASRAGSFVYVETITGAKGWMKVGDAELSQDVSIAPVESSGQVEIAEPMEPAFAVTGDGVVLDAAHEVIGSEVETVWADRTGTLLGKTRAGNYYYVETDTGAMGWLHNQYIETSFPIERLTELQSGSEDVEIAAPLSFPVFTIPADADAVLRTEAHEALGADLETLAEGRTGSFLGKSSAGNFFYVEMDNGAKGWVASDSVETEYPTDLLRVEASGSVEIVPVGQVTPATGLNMRSTPSAETDDNIVVALSFNSYVSLVGISPDGTWLYVGADGNEGWVSAEYVNTEYDTTTLPVMEPEVEETEGEGEGD